MWAWRITSFIRYVAALYSTLFWYVLILFFMNRSKKFKKVMVSLHWHPLKMLKDLPQNAAISLFLGLLSLAPSLTTWRMAFASQETTVQCKIWTIIYHSNNMRSLINTLLLIIPMLCHRCLLRLLNSRLHCYLLLLILLCLATELHLLWTQDCPHQLIPIFQPALLHLLWIKYFLQAVLSSSSYEHTYIFAVFFLLFSIPFTISFSLLLSLSS